MSNKKSQRSWIGIDVSKQLLEVAVHKSDYHFRVPNDPKKFPTLIAELIALRPARIVLEATGGLEVLLATQLAAAGLPVVVINPRQARDFAKATGQLAKADQVDEDREKENEQRGFAHGGAKDIGNVRRWPLAVGRWPLAVE